MNKIFVFSILFVLNPLLASIQEEAAVRTFLNSYLEPIKGVSRESCSDSLKQAEINWIVKKLDIKQVYSALEQETLKLLEFNKAHRDDRYDFSHMITAFKFVSLSLSCFGLTAYLFYKDRVLKQSLAQELDKLGIKIEQTSFPTRSGPYKENDEFRTDILAVKDSSRDIDGTFRINLDQLNTINTVWRNYRKVDHASSIVAAIAGIFFTLPAFAYIEKAMMPHYKTYVEKCEILLNTIEQFQKSSEAKKQ